MIEPLELDQNKNNKWTKKILNICRPGGKMIYYMSFTKISWQNVFKKKKKNRTTSSLI